jgi:hypothetical protein
MLRVSTVKICSCDLGFNDIILDIWTFYSRIVFDLFEHNINKVGKMSVAKSSMYASQSSSKVVAKKSLVSLSKIKPKIVKRTDSIGIALILISKFWN